MRYFHFRGILPELRIGWRNGDAVQMRGPSGMLPALVYGKMVDEVVSIRCMTVRR